MRKKLTVSIEYEVIEQAKLYAQRQQRSLSSIIEKYLKSLSIRKKQQNPKFSQNIEELWGSVKYDTDKTDKELIKEALLKKYL